MVFMLANIHQIVLSITPPNNSVFHKVEQTGKLSKDSYDSKVASSKIKIGAEIGIPGLVKAAIEYTTSFAKPENGATGYCGVSSVTGYCGASSATGDFGASSATGYCGVSSAGNPTAVAVAWGYNSKAKGVIGSFLVFADWGGDESCLHDPKYWKLKGAKMVQVDGEIIKADTYYTIINGKIVKAR